MSAITREGFGALKFAYLTLVAGIGVAVFLVLGSYFYWQAEKRNDQQSMRTLGDVQARLANAKRERDDLRNSEDTYTALIAHGVFVPEQRLDFVDALDQLKRRHSLLSLEYELSPQRSLTLAGGMNLAAIDALGTRIKIRAKAVHDRDMFAFLDEFSRLQRGIFQTDKCHIQRSQASLVAAKAPAAPDAPERASGVDTPAKLVAGIEASCSMEWITLADKRAAPPATPAKESALSGSVKGKP
jgi:hypothetical protein